MAKDYSYYFSQLRRIEDHREKEAEKEIRKLYRQIAADMRQFLADEYYLTAEDGKLTYELLRAKGRDARFLQEVEERLDDMSRTVANEIRDLVDGMYTLAFDGLRETVEKGVDTASFFQGVTTSTAAQMRNAVSNIFLETALDKNHKDIVWNIKREIATSLSVGDRYDSMARRLVDKVDMGYRKAMQIARTETHRVREAGHLDAATELDKTLRQGASGLRYVKKWKTMKDGAVRPNVRRKTKGGWKSGKPRPGAPDHVKMYDVVVLVDEPFDLGGGVTAMAPGQSGVAGHDINCRCTMLTLMMTDAQFFKATGRHFPVENSDNGDIIEVGSAPYDEFDRKARIYDYDEDLAAVNPNFATGDYCWTHNCQRCVATYDMRRRGYNVTAQRIYGVASRDQLALNPYSIWEGVLPTSCPVGTGKADIEAFLFECEDGARVMVNILYDRRNMRHVFVAERRANKIVYVDPQTGISDCSSYFDIAARGCTTFARIDKATPSDLILQCCTNIR